MYTGLYALAMITTLMPHLRIGPYKEGVIIDQIQMPFHAVERSFPYELLVLVRVHNIILYIMYSWYIYSTSCAAIKAAVISSHYP